jgi:hypothetical protein
VGFRMSSDAPWPLKTLAILGFVTGMSGLLGTGWSEHEAFFASGTTPKGDYTVPYNLKGRLVYLRQSDGEIYSVSTVCLIGGFATFALSIAISQIPADRRRSSRPGA